MNIGYIRCSTKDQNPARQEDLMKKLGVEKVYVDMMSGKNTERPQLRAMLDFMREGDVIVVESFSRLARNARDLLNITDEMSKKGVQFISQKETIDTSTPVGKALLTILGAISELERDYILSRQAEGIEIYKASGGYIGKPASKVSAEKFAEVYTRWKSGEINAIEGTKEMGYSRSMFYRLVREYEKNGNKLPDKRNQKA